MHQQQTSHSNSTTSSSTSKTVDDSTSAENQTSPASLSTPIESDVAFRRMQTSNPIPIRKCDVTGFRTSRSIVISRSEDHLQHSQRDLIDSIVPIDVEDVNSSLNTLLDTRDDSEGTTKNNHYSILS